MIISTVLSDKPLIEGNSVTLPIVRNGTLARDSKGKIHKIIQSAIDSSADTYTDGEIVNNHSFKEMGTIVKSWQDGEFIMATVDNLSDELVARINSDEYRGVSQESSNAVFDSDGNVISLNGTGVSFIFSDHPEKPGCPLEMGCGVPLASTVVERNGDEEVHMFDVAVVNNAGNLIKIRDIRIWLPLDEAEKETILTRRLVEEAAYGVGPGVFKFYDTDPELRIGDQLPEDTEPAHTLDVLLSTLDSFNFPLNTPNQKLESNTPGGVNIADDTTKLESTISEQSTEIETLKSTVAELRQELKKKDETIKSTAETAASAAIEGYIKSTAEKQDRDAVMTELKSCVSEEKLKTLEALPIEALKSTLEVIKDAAGKQIGANAGTLQSTATDADDFMITVEE